MDPITHGLIGASATQSLANKQNLRHLSFVGLVSALLPDLDVLIGSPTDPLLTLEYHRQFTHSFLFSPIGALIASGLSWWFVRKQLSFIQTYLFSLLAYISAALADTFTSYGVQLFWPITNDRFAWNLISVFDPLFSLLLVFFVGLAFYKKKQLFAWLGIAWMAVYLSFGFSQQQMAQNLAIKLANQRGHQIERLIVKPTIANELLWSIRYVHGDSLYADGIRLLPLSEPTIYEGKAARILSWKQQYAQFKGTTLYKDIQRFSNLSDGILIAHPDHQNVIGDGRYAMLPTSVSPLWGIEIDTLKPNKHVAFKTYRKATRRIRARFKNMLLGRPVPKSAK